MIALCGVITIVILATSGTFVKSGKSLMGDLSNAFAIPGFIATFWGLLIFLTNGGAFDFLAFGFIKFFDMFKRDLTKVKYRTYYDYRKAQEEKKYPFAFILIVGLGYLLVAAVFLILFYRY